MPSPFSFADKRVVVTGAASGMGRAAVTHLLADGAEVHAIDVMPIDLPVAETYRLDLRDPVAIDGVTARIAADLGPLDAVLNCAGLPHSSFAPAEIFQVNFLGMRRLTEGLAPLVRSGGAIGSIASKAGINWPSLRPTIDEVLPLDDDAARTWFASRPELHEEAYGFSKACVIVWTMVQATPYGRRGLRINCVSPGATDTPMMDHFRKRRTEEQLVRATGVIGRMARPEEPALALLFLASDAASYVSGVNLVVDAGALAGFVNGQLAPPDVAQYADADVEGGVGLQ
jgi:NAD(P)-dependent dehydrogenase (short-subunit alcohol dehydrogenase family)